MKSALEHHFLLSSPCDQCPFLKTGAIELAPGRLEGIVQQLVADDHSTFQCHKTTHHASRGGCWDEDGTFLPSGQECMCAGAMIYLEKVGRPTVGMRLAALCGLYNRETLEGSFGLVIDPN